MSTEHQATPPITTKKVSYSKAIDMEIECHRNNVISKITKYKNGTPEKTLSFYENGEIKEYIIYKNGKKKVSGIYENSELKFIKSNTVICELYLNALRSLNLYTDTTTKLKRTEFASVPLPESSKTY